MIRFVPPFRGRYIASISGGVTENIARVGVAIGVTCATTVVHDASASASVSVSAQAKGHYTYFAIADVTISATAAGQRTVSGTGNIGVDITSTADGSVSTAHSGVATVGVTIEATAAAATGTTHSSSTAECQVNISTSANGYNISDTIPDETANGNNMVMEGTGWTFETDAAVGNRSVDFGNSNDTYGIIDESYLSVFRSPWSFSCWYKPDDGTIRTTGGGTSILYLLHTGINGTSGGSHYQMYHYNRKLRWWSRIDTTGNSTLRDTTNNVFSEGTGNDWVHIVVTVDNVGNPTMYLDGSETTLTTDSTPNTLNISNYSNTSDVRIGLGRTGYTDGYKIDDVSIWSTELTSTQVSNLYNSGSGTDLTGSSNLAGWWRMGDSNVVPVTHSGTATVSVDVTASASGDTFTTHAGTASCQVNLSISAYADNPAGDFYYNAWEVDSSNALIVTTKRDDADDNYEIYASGNGMFLGYGGTGTGGFGNIAEIIVIDSYVSLELRDKIEGYLLHKWNIVDQATSGSHTYFGSAPSWTPADITTKLWLDANDSSTITTTSSGGYDYVTQWNDKSGNGEHAIQNTSSDRPWTETHSILGSTIRFGEQDHLENSTFSDLLSSSGFSVFAAYHCRITGSGNAVLWLTGDANSAGNVEIVEQLSGNFRNRIRGGNGGYHYTPQTGSETFRNKIQVISSLFKGKLRNVVTGTASCQVNLSASASGTVTSPDYEQEVSEITSLKGWFDANKPNGTDQTGFTNGTAVTTWTSRVGTSVTLGQSTASAKPTWNTSQINSLPAIDFAVGDWLNSTSTDIKDIVHGQNNIAITTYVVMQVDNYPSSSGAGDAMVLGWEDTVTSVGSQDVFHLPRIERGTGYLQLLERAGGTGLTNLAGYEYQTAIGTGSYKYFGCIAGATSITLRVNGSEQTMSNYLGGTWNTAQTHDAHQLQVGGFSNAGGSQLLLDGKIAEILIFNSTLGSTDIASVENYITDKYNL